ncbi:ATP-binding protein [Streptomyces sp. NPDC016845]|uniref:ATP-binding protein n=1 Tax=Streptomyces sp. NPDC016845 TaxID=3364972 RepID=UPI0037A86ED8
MDKVPDGCSGTVPSWLGVILLQPTPDSVPRARRWFRRFIAPYNPDDPACLLDDCELLLSELVTNAVLYGQALEPWLVRVEWYKVRTSLRVDVHNAGVSADVRVRHAEADQAHGRGLFLVDCIAESWHSGPSRFGGTVVSAVVADVWPVGAVAP